MQRKNGRKNFSLSWRSYALALELSQKDEDVQVGMLLTVIGAEAQEVYTTLTWTDRVDAGKIDPVLKQFQDYCEPKKNVLFERYCFNQRHQQPGVTYDQYKPALKKLAEGCAFSSITPDEILSDRLVLGIADNKVRKRLLRKSDLTLKKTDELCHAAEQMTLPS